MLNIDNAYQSVDKKKEEENLKKKLLLLPKPKKHEPINSDDKNLISIKQNKD